ncbi:MAG TPA: hypothetical protein VEY67_05435, partial [Candidatus Dormibacteraeota bacterium]|nr:hypothetical protein [Candidatus Dormibacteraeota bacterium]
PVAGATLLVKASNGSELARVVTAADGRFAVALPAGSYTLVPQRVQGILTVAPPVAFSVAAGHVPTDLRVEYDTGIR